MSHCREKAEYLLLNTQHASTLIIRQGRLLALR